MLGQLVYAVISLYLSWKLIVELVPGSSALWGVLLTWLGSFMFYYQSSMMGMSHNMNFCFEITSFYCAREIERAPTKVWFWFGLGLFTALDSVTRYASSVLLVYPFVQFVRFGVLNKRWKEVMVVAAGFVLVISIQMLLWKIVFGQPIVNPYGASISWFQADFFQTFFSTFHGACYWHPILLPGWLLFIFWVFRHRSVAAWCWLTSAFLTTWVNAAWGPSTYGSSFGLRAFDGAVFFSMLGLAYGFSLLDSRPRQRVFVVMVLYLLCIWNVLLAYTARKNVLNTNAPYTYVQMWQVMEHFYLPTKA